MCKSSAPLTAQHIEKAHQPVCSETAGEGLVTHTPAISCGLGRSSDNEIPLLYPASASVATTDRGGEPDLRSSPVITLGHRKLQKALPLLQGIGREQITIQPNPPVKWLTV